MKKFVLHFLIFLIPVAIVIGFLEVTVRNNPKKLKSEYIYSHLQETEVLILGPSTIACALNPEYFSQPTASLALTGNTIPADYQIFEKFKDRLPQLRWVIMDLSKGYLDYSDPQFDLSSSLLNHYQLTGEAKDLQLRDLLVTTANFKFAVNKTRDIYLKGDSEKYNEYGFITELNETSYSFKKMNYDPKRIAANPAVNKIFDLHSLTNDQVYHYNFETLRKTIKYCRENDIKVLLLSSPKYAYYQNADNNYAERRQKFLRLMVDNKHVFFKDDETWNNTQTTHFYDMLHLNPDGAKLYSEYISNYLKMLKF